MRMLNHQLSPLSLKNVSTVLKPNAVHFSPSIGLLRVTAPHITANFRSSQQCGKLTSELYHQRSYIKDGILLDTPCRYGPVGVTKSRSRAAYWLSPQVIGTVAGLAERAKENAVDDACIDAALKGNGIICNYAADQWTGVSLARYRKLVRLLSSKTAHDTGIDSGELNTLLSFLWEKSATKQCLLDYYLAVERASGTSILKDTYTGLRDPYSAARSDWLSARWDGTDLIRGNTTAALRTVQEQPYGDASADAIDLLAASYALERSFKPPIKLGRYSFQEGRPRPDCVEVVVREIVDSIIFDPSLNRLCPERLPDTAQPAVKKFYQALAEGQIDDVSTAHAHNALNKQSKALKGTNISAENQRGEDASSVSEQPTQAPQQQYWEATTAGQVWFDLCSALPGLQYLSAAKVSSGNELPYELKPAMDNVCAALSALLGLQRQNSGTEHSALTTPGMQRPWSLKDIEVSWNDRARAQQQEIGTAREIVTTQGVVRFRAPFSDTEMITREVGSIRFVGDRRSIDIELEGAHQLATVKHRLGRGSDDQELWSLEMVEAIGLRYEHRVRSAISAPPDAVTSIADASDLIQQALESTVLGDRKLATLAAVLSAHPHCSKSPQLDELIVDALVTSRWGEERRTGADFGNTTGGSGKEGTVLSLTDASLTSADAKTQALESVEMTLRALKVIAHCSDAPRTAQLVRWMLQEAPNEITALQLGPALLRIDPAVRGQLAFQQELRELFAPTATGTAKVLGKVLLFDTPQCPSKSVFSLPGRGGGQDSLSLRDRWGLLRVFLQHKFAGETVTHQR